MLPSVGPTGPESDSDSGMGSPPEELLPGTTGNQKEELQGEVTLKYRSQIQSDQLV